MLPLRLELRNFLPYRAPQPLELADLRLACLSGVNGAGKSALLDAITWALWGKARARREEDLIHHGTSEMYVQLDFEQHNERYRVLRRRWRGSRSRATRGSLHLYRLEQGEVIDISAASLTATDERLRQLLRLDYETFIHSAFLLQGRSDAFTVRSPRERQQLLANILRLGRWGAAAERARAQETEAASRCAHLAEQQAQLAAELAQTDAIQRNRQAAETTHQTAQQALQLAEAHWSELQAARSDFRHWQNELAAARARLAECERNRSAAISEAERWSERLATLRQILANRAVIQQDYDDLTRARAADQALREQLQDLRQWDVEIAQLESQIQADRQALEAERRRLTSALEEETRSRPDTDDTALPQLQAKILDLGRLAEENTVLRRQHEKSQEERRQREAHNRSLRGEMEQLREQIDALSHTEEGGRCPLCGQTLSEEHRQQTLNALQERGQKRGDAFRENQAWLREQRGPSRNQLATLQENERTLLTLPELRARAQELNLRQRQEQSARQQWAALRAELEQLQDQLASESFSAEARQQLARAHSEREKITQQTHPSGASQLTPDEWAEREARHRELTAAHSALPQVEDALAAAQSRLAELDRAHRQASETLAEWQASETTLRDSLAQAQEAEKALQLARITERQSFQTLLSAQQEEAALARQRERGQRLASEWEAAEQQRTVYAELRRAFGPDGIPALLIESAIPEIQEEANALLELLSEPPLRLELHLSRRGTVESLGIRVRDEHDSRSYELFSGGEAFRIHFALRVALARLLARHSGTQLRTLFVDEGFGTQDAEGRERLIRALAAVQYEFSLILVITHLDEVRAAFPRQILVQPGAEGSQWQLI
ncbi:MAG: SMC family ATPase [Anaerolineaceae bacterium]|nr:SMC family ATPase [Anaerolineaceae bacterium]